ncbi:hypothetical protein JOL79_29325 [Microbispora sp. RL4-1S]|uniref:Uncharacterized protein n=1 Tax=Microbispora oryzae TaxID=2806554 RepID=A0A940WVY4_9ACTN|nr:hypothetical protein [Microbispora oryzae]MBP2707889.1 hypothetical protein [Microbispora oryzae]
MTYWPAAGLALVLGGVVPATSLALHGDPFDRLVGAHVSPLRLCGSSG